VSNYYVLECIGGRRSLRFQLEADCHNGECWHMGRLFSSADEDRDFHPPSKIIELRTKIDSKVRERVYSELTWDPLPLMSRRLVAAFKDAGINNLQTFETRLINPQGDPPVPDNQYLAVNIVGLVAAANLLESETNPAVEDKVLSMDFQSLVIDPLKARNLPMFRLAENISAVLVHERIKNFVQSKGIDTLTWYEPEAWAG
jgi:hypothetical protein